MIMVRWTSVPICPDPDCEGIMGYVESNEIWRCTECSTTIDDEEFDD